MSILVYNNLARSYYTLSNRIDTICGRLFSNPSENNPDD